MRTHTFFRLYLCSRVPNYKNQLTQCQKFPWWREDRITYYSLSRENFVWCHFLWKTINAIDSCFCWRAWFFFVAALGRIHRCSFLWVIPLSKLGSDDSNFEDLYVFASDDLFAQVYKSCSYLEPFGRMASADTTLSACTAFGIFDIFDFSLKCPLWFVAELANAFGRWSVCMRLWNCSNGTNFLHHVIIKTACRTCLRQKPFHEKLIPTIFRDDKCIVQFWLDFLFSRERNYGSLAENGRRWIGRGWEIHMKSLNFYCYHRSIAVRSTNVPIQYSIAVFFHVRFTWIAL